MSNGEERVQAAVVGSVIAWHRQHQDLSQRQLSELARVPQSTLSRIERGEVLPDILTFRRLANALEVDVEDLLDQADEGLKVVEAAAEATSRQLHPTQPPPNPWWEPLLAVGAAALIGGAVAMALNAVVSGDDEG